MDYIQLDQQSVLDILPNRHLCAHKGDFGRVLLLCGSEGYTGAAALAALGALRVGAGLVYLGVPRSIYTIEAMKLTEPIVFPLPDCCGSMSINAISVISNMITKIDAVLIGPGVGRSEDVSIILEWLLTSFHGPIVVDADGIFLLRDHIDVLRGRMNPTILTPHEGEFTQLLGTNISDRSTSAIDAAQKLKSIIVLKGHNTVITDGDTVYMNPTGNPGMAVGGSGDVLAGMIVGLLGQKLNPLQASAVGAWVHGAAGDICASQIGMYGMLPSDMLDVIPRLLK